MEAIIQFIIDNLVEICLVIQIGLIFSSYKDLKKNLDANPYGEYNNSQNMATWGVFFTFLGIALGLMNFDVENLQSSLPQLLSGMKTAFWTSIVGMVASMRFKHIQFDAQQKNTQKEDKVDENSTIADLIKYMQDKDVKQREWQEKQLKLAEDNHTALVGTITDAVEQMKNSLVGDGDHSINTQMRLLNGTLENVKSCIGEIKNNEQDIAKNQRDWREQQLNLLADNKNSIIELVQKMRENIQTQQQWQTQQIKIAKENHEALIDKMTGIETTISNGNNKLINEFQDFARQMAENNSKALIEALTGVVRKFNEKIQEQFGENFKHLNEAVGKLLEWQENYKNTVEETNKCLTQATESIDSATISIEEATENQKQIFAGIDSARNSLAAMSESVQSISDAANKLAAVAEMAKERELMLEMALKGLEELSEQAGNVVPEIRNMMQATTGEINSVMQNIQNVTEKAKDNIINLTSSAMGSITKCVQETMDKNKQTIKDETGLISDFVQDSANNMKKEMKDLVKDSIDKFNGHIEQTVRDSSGKINEYMKDVGKSVKETNEKSIKEIKTSCESVTKSVNNTMVDLTEKHEKLGKYAQTSIQKITENSGKAVSSISELSTNISEETQKQQAEISRLVNATVEKIKVINERTQSEIDAASRKLQEESYKITEGISRDIKNMIETSNGNFEAQSKAFSNELETKIKDTMTSFGSAMVKISNKFVSDYTPLAEKLQRVVNIANSIETRRPMI